MVSWRCRACWALILATPLVSILVNLRLFCTTFHVAGRNDDERVPQAHFRIRLRLANWYLFEVIVYQKRNFCFRFFFSKIRRFSSTLGSSTLLIPLCEFYVWFFAENVVLWVLCFCFCWKCCLYRPRNASIDVRIIKNLDLVIASLQAQHGENVAAPSLSSQVGLVWWLFLCAFVFGFFLCVAFVKQQLLSQDFACIMDAALASFVAGQ